MALFSPVPDIDHARVVDAIHAAERQTSGEIRVVLSRRAARDAMTIAQREFNRLHMDRTAARNGVLIFIAPRSRTFAVIGDTAVHAKCGEAFWRELTEAMAEHFQRAEFTAGLVHGIERAGALLAAHFPRSPNDRNELPDGIVED